ncbi:MAG: hypothetical protein AAFQ83_20875 [Bacteroidota bacterium]
MSIRSHITLDSTGSEFLLLGSLHFAKKLQKNPIFMMPDPGGEDEKNNNKGSEPKIPIPRSPNKGNGKLDPEKSKSEKQSDSSKRN